jgi:hypothetical protein
VRNLPHAPSCATNCRVEPHTSLLIAPATRTSVAPSPAAAAAVAASSPSAAAGVGGSMSHRLPISSRSYGSCCRAPSSPPADAASSPPAWGVGGSAPAPHNSTHIETFVSHARCSLSLRTSLQHIVTSSSRLLTPCLGSWRQGTCNHNSTHLERFTVTPAVTKPAATF